MCVPLTSSIPNAAKAVTLTTDKVFRGRDGGGGYRIDRMIFIFIYLSFLKRKIALAGVLIDLEIDFMCECICVEMS